MQTPTSPLNRFLKWLRSSDEIDLRGHVQNLTRIRSSKWKNDPFPYLIIDNFFSESYSREISKAFANELQTRGLKKDGRDSERFATMPGYDAYNYTPKPSLEGAFRVFYSREWYNLFRRLSKIDLDENVMTTLHHHITGSESGYIHSDFGTYAFRKEPSSNELNNWYNNCQYQTHDKNENLHLQDGVVTTRRALALIYYIGTTPWDEEDGGETGLFANKTDAASITKVAPKPNRLLVFQIQPNSYHAFLKNHNHERNSLIQWFHEPHERTEKRLGISPKT